MIDDLLRPAPLGPRPPEDGFVTALRAARRRRWRALRNAAACGTAAVAAVVATVTPRLMVGSMTGLEPANPGVTRTYQPPARGGASPSPTPTPSVPAPSERAEAPAGPYGGARAGDGSFGGYAPAPQPGGQPAPPAAPRPRSAPPSAWPSATEPPDAGGGPAGPSHEPSPSPVPTSPPAPSPSPSPEPPPSHEPVDLSHEDQSVNAPCESSSWCLSAQVSGPSNGAYTLRLRACRSASDTRGGLDFTTENEADFRVTSGGAVVWQWSTLERSDPRFAHTVTVDRWQCAVWSTAWHANDLDGDRAGAGRYELGAMSRATNLPDVWHTRSFDVA